MKRITEQRIGSWVNEDDTEPLDDFDNGYASAKAHVSRLLEEEASVYMEKDMTLVDRFAIEVMKAIMNLKDAEYRLAREEHEDIADQSYKIAEEMMARSGRY